MQTIHVICVALVLSSVLMIEFRILGCTGSGAVADAAWRFVPWICVFVALMALIETVLIVGEPERSQPSFEFRMKMLFLAVAFTVSFSYSVRTHEEAWADKVECAHGSYDPCRACARRVVCLFVQGWWIAYTVQHRRPRRERRLSEDETADFQLKFVCMGLAFVNMPVFQMFASKSVTKWDRGTPRVAAKVAGPLSLVFWIGVICFARMTGFTMVQGGA
jgi:hypothetical protein